MNVRRLCGFFTTLGLSALLVSSLLIITPIHPAHANPTIHYVAPSGNCNGVSPCYGDIQSAITATVDDDEIRVAEGAYSQVNTGDGITAVVLIVNKVISVTGGYSTADWNTSNPTVHPTVIDPQDNGVGIYITHHDIGIAYISIDGFTITGGNAADATAGTDSGGAIFIDQTAHKRVIIQNCDIYENTAENSNGGGIWVARSDNINLLNSDIHDNQGSGVVITYSANPVIVDNLIEDNAGVGIKIISADGQSTDIHGNTISGNQGSGISIRTVLGGSLTDNTITGNTAESGYGGGGLNVSGAINDFLIGSNTIMDNSSIQGGGIDISGSIARIVNNRIESNYTTSISNGGGGLYVDAGATGAYTQISGNQVFSNTTSNMGGGMVVLGQVDVTGNTVMWNTGYSGGGMVATATGTIRDNLIAGNRAQLGGGIRTVNATGLMIERNRVFDNHATNGAGGGMNLWGGFFFDITLIGNQVISNTATAQGGGIYIECPREVDPVQVGSTVLANNSASTGSGLYSTVCDIDMAYSTVASNGVATGDGVGLYLRDPSSTATYTIENSIVVNQTAGIYVHSGSASLEATFWGNDAWANDANTGGGGTIDMGTNEYQGDPGFIDPANDDYHIVENSPVIDKAIDTWATVDMDGQSRPAGEADIGADEYGETIEIYLPLLMR